MRNTIHSIALTLLTIEISLLHYNLMGPLQSVCDLTRISLSINHHNFYNNRLPNSWLIRVSKMAQQVKTVYLTSDRISDWTWSSSTQLAWLASMPRESFRSFLLSTGARCHILILNLGAEVLNFMCGKPFTSWATEPWVSDTLGYLSSEQHSPNVIPTYR